MQNPPYSRMNWRIPEKMLKVDLLFSSVSATTIAIAIALMNALANASALAGVFVMIEIWSSSANAMSANPPTVANKVPSSTAVLILPIPIPAPTPANMNAAENPITVLFENAYIATKAIRDNKMLNNLIFHTFLFSGVDENNKLISTFSSNYLF